MSVILACYHGNQGETWRFKRVGAQLFVNYEIASEEFFVSDWEKSVIGIHAETGVVFEDVWAFNSVRGVTMVVMVEEAWQLTQWRGGFGAVGADVMTFEGAIQVLKWTIFNCV